MYVHCTRNKHLYNWQPTTDRARPACTATLSVQFRDILSVFISHSSTFLSVCGTWIYRLLPALHVLHNSTLRYVHYWKRRRRTEMNFEPKVWNHFERMLSLSLAVFTVFGLEWPWFWAWSL